MHQRKDCEYMLLDGMPVVVRPDKSMLVLNKANL